MFWIWASNILFEHLISFRNLFFSTLIIGTPNGWFLKLSTRVHIDQIMIALGQSCAKLERLEIQWDPDTIRSGDNSSKFIDMLR